jgi:signal transduction histidine kinase
MPESPFVMPSAAASDQDDLPLVVLDDAPGVPTVSHGAQWRVLIVDDAEEVHAATEFALHDVVIEGRPLTLLHAHSAAEALSVIASDEDIAAVLLDVVMETPDAGLQLVKRIREDLGRVALRIILRTGQPGYAPELETLRAFDINDYRTKDELTRTRLFTSLTAAIRTFKLLVQTIRQRDELQHLNASLKRARVAEQIEAERRMTAEAALRLANEGVEQCVEQRTQELSRAISELESFNRMVSHDLRAPLHGLAGLSSLMQKELEAGNTAELRRWLGLLEQQTRYLANLVTDLLDLARVSRGALECRPVALNAVVADALQTLAVTHPAERLTCVAVGSLPELSGDAGLLRQVFVNLLSNAMKFTRNMRSPRVEVRAEFREGHWILVVQDNGVGFDIRRVGELFKPFSRLHGSAFEGAGIGLTIAQRIVERHGGRIWAETTPGGGATFAFWLAAGH